ncbi:DsbA family protein [Skermanella pratensis]|uniref:DsbA family protein n=1 Tax=Skermanella pratensis TaxID=2233999 RepID=UPI001FE8DA30|nr:DsbA family protein [Skermanella pratensis]
MHRPAFPPRMIAAAALSALVGLASPTGAQAQQPALDTPAGKAAIEQIVRDYLLAHPEVLVESLTAFQERQEAAQAEAQRGALVSRQEELFRNPASPVAGNPQGDVTLVEFFDYQCGYCKTVHADVRRLLESDGKLRLVYKEFPILGPASLTASRAALAAHRQGKYEALHVALMENRGQLDDDKILRIAGSVGLDMERLKRDMESPEIQEALQRNLRLASELNIRGTPAFVVGDQIIPGAVGLDRLKELVAAGRAG